VIENELFGHEREAYTGAVTSRRGAFELANGSTLFLDEIGEMHQQVQAKLLRAIEMKSFRRLGGHEDTRVDVRVVAATNREIPEALATGVLREDLYYRLSVVEIFLPPLRERQSDVLLLADHFVSLFSEKYHKSPRQLSGETREILESYSWPGNVRELRNIIESVVLICPNEEIRPENIPARIASRPHECGEVRLPFGLTLEEVEQAYVLRALALANGNKSAAARSLGMSRKSLYDRLGRYLRRGSASGRKKHPSH
jgi:transcriptional regulator with PAS, ATPase and Fis domain